MTEYILLATGLIICIVGLAEILHSVKLFLFSSNKKSSTYSLVILSNENYLGQLRYVAEQRNWLGSKYADYVVAINDFLDFDNINKASTFAKSKGIMICSLKQFESVILYFKKEGYSECKKT